MEVLYGGINPKNPGGRQQFFWMAINGKNMDLLGFASTKNNNGQLMLRAGIGTLPDKKSKIEISQSLVVGKTYLLDYVYDPRGGSNVWNVIDRATGQLVASIADQPQRRQHPLRRRRTHGGRRLLQRQRPGRAAVLQVDLLGVGVRDLGLIHARAPLSHFTMAWRIPFGRAPFPAAPETQASS